MPRRQTKRTKLIKFLMGILILTGAGTFSIMQLWPILTEGSCWIDETGAIGLVTAIVALCVVGMVYLYEEYRL